MMIKQLIQEELKSRFKELVKNKIKNEFDEPYLTDEGHYQFYLKNTNKKHFVLNVFGGLNFTSWVTNFCEDYDLTLEQFRSIVKEIVEEFKLNP